MKFENSGHISAGRDFIITDNSQSFKLLNQCTNEELLEEREFRKDRLKIERKKKGKRFLVSLSITMIGILR